MNPEPTRVRRRGDVIAVPVGLALLGAGMFTVRDGAVPSAEEALFSSINGLPDGLYPLVWPFQQLGVVGVGPAAALVAVVMRRFRLAVAALTATVAKLALERVVKAIASRGRPGRSLGTEVELRGDVSDVGEAFVSGHAVLAAAIAGLVAPYLPGRWRLLPWVLAGLVLFARVYVGAHNPLDVVCGAALGVVVASGLNLTLGVPARRSG